MLSPVADPDLQIRGGWWGSHPDLQIRGGGGGGGSHPDPEIRGSFEPQFGLKIRGAWAPPLDLPMVSKGLRDYAWL